MNKKITYFLTILFLGTVLFSEVFAGGAKRNGTAGAQELLIPSSASGLALNGANISSITGLDAVFYNPAGFGGSQTSTEAMFSHLNYIADISMSFAAVGVSFSELGSLAFSLRTLNFGDIPITTVENPYGTGSMYSPSYVTLGLTYANSVTDRIRVGFNLKLVSEKIVRTSATGFALDAGIQYQGLAGLDGLSFGITLKNLGPQMKFDGPDLIRSAAEIEAKRGNNYYMIDAASFELHIISVNSIRWSSLQLSRITTLPMMNINLAESSFMMICSSSVAGIHTWVKSKIMNINNSSVLPPELVLK